MSNVMIKDLPNNDKPRERFAVMLISPEYL